MSSNNQTKFTGVKGWIDHRLPIFSFLEHQGEYQTPRNLNYLWNFGSIAGICLMIQIVTGIFLAMNYQPNADLAFDSVERIMRDVPYGWLLRYIHAVGASMFFIAVYIHIFRGLFYGSYKAPREILWWFGILIFLMMMATAFLGYTLPWGQMSLWGATVITNLFTAFDEIYAGLGTGIREFLLGDYSAGNATINRFFTLHYLLPFVILGLVVVHVLALHTHGSNNPTGVDVKTKKDTINFHPYYTVKDFFGFGVFFLIFAWFVFYAPNYMGHADNYIKANPLQTPPHIVPEWYFLPFYAILRAVPDLAIPAIGFLGMDDRIVLISSKLGGVLLMFGSILILFVLPWLDRHPVRSGAYRPLFQPFFAIFVVVCIALGWLGAMPAEQPYVMYTQICTVYYFAYFLVILPILSKRERAKALPESIAAGSKK